MTRAGSQGGDSGKAKVFFDRADEVAETANWDFAIELYLQGLEREPENIARGHNKLREVSLKRKVQGGKNAGMMEQLKRRPGKDPMINLLNAEYLMAKEPGSVSYMQQVLQAAKALKISPLIKWICDILLEAQRQAAKPDKGVLQLIMESYHDIEEYGAASQACEMARQLAPSDAKLQEWARELSAKYTIKKGKYDQEGGDFTKSVKDMKAQIDLVEKDSLVKGQDYITRVIAQAKAEYEASPTVPGKIAAYVDALLKPEDESFDNEAIAVLKKAHAQSGAYQFKMKAGDIMIRQMGRRYRKLIAAGEKPAAVEYARQILQFELKEYSERVANYPTDLVIKFELGKRQLLAANQDPSITDEAIASFQQAKRDPRYRLNAMNYLGIAFAKKGWFKEAADTYEEALQVEMPEERLKELLLNHADVLEKMNNLAKAQEQLSRLAQMDFMYKDVRQRLERVRGKLGGGGA